MEKSKFGKGLVICLVKFAEHRWRWHEQKEAYLKVGLPISRAIEIFFNAAADHLYEIEVPDEWKDTELGQKVRELQSYGLEIGHGFTDKTWEESDIDNAYTMCQEIALLVDKAIGLTPQIGQW